MSAVALGASHLASSREARQVLVLVAQLAQLVEALARHRAAQGREHQAAAARRSAAALRQHHAQTLARTAGRALTQDSPAVALRATQTAAKGRTR